jgi:hypothetical protein
VEDDDPAVRQAWREVELERAAVKKREAEIARMMADLKAEALERKRAAQRRAALIDDLVERIVAAAPEPLRPYLERPVRPRLVAAPDEILRDDERRSEWLSPAMAQAREELRRHGRIEELVALTRNHLLARPDLYPSATVWAVVRSARDYFGGLPIGALCGDRWTGHQISILLHDAVGQPRPPRPQIQDDDGSWRGVQPGE